MDDLVLRVKQIGAFPNVVPAASDAILLQQGGLGGAYAWTSPSGLVSPFTTPLQTQLNGLMIQFSTFNETLADFQTAWSEQFSRTIEHITDNTVWSFNGRRGDVCLSTWDLVEAGAATADNAHLTGYPTAPDPEFASATDDQIANTRFVQRAIMLRTTEMLNQQPFVFAFNGRIGRVCLLFDDVQAALWEGEPKAKTPLESDFSGRIATTKFVHRLVDDFELDLQALSDRVDQEIDVRNLATLDYVRGNFVTLHDSTLGGYATAPTPPPGSNDARIATTAFVINAMAEAVAGVSTWNGRSGAVTLTAADLTGVGGALLVSPQFSGTPLAPTATPGTNTGQLATTAFVMAALAGVEGVSSFNTRTGSVTLTWGDVSAVGAAPIASPTFTGVPAGPTAAVGTSSTQLATTAFVALAIAAAVVTGVTSFNGRTGAVGLNANDISASGGALLNAPHFTGVPTAPTASQGTNTTQLATTEFVQAAVAAATAGVASFNGRTGDVLLTTGDITSAGGAPLASPNLTGSPTAPTQTAGTSNTTLATTAFVMAALAASGVASFNTRTGAVTLLLSDITGVGGAPLASPTFTGTPSGPTATAGTSTTQFATTAFVSAAIAAAGGVASFNGRTGAVTLAANDVSAVGGAMLAGPAFTGVPTAPTAVAGTNTTQLATTAFVSAAIAAATGVASFNGRAGAVTLTATDVSGVGGALLASPAFSGTPTAPTAAQTVNNTQIATTAFVTTKVAGYLPLTGGTLTGDLTMTGNVIFQSGQIQFANGSGLGQYGFAIGSAYAQTAVVWTGIAQLYASGASVGNIITSTGDGGSLYPIQSMYVSAETSQGLINLSGSTWAFSISYSDRQLKSNIEAPVKRGIDVINALDVHAFDLDTPLGRSQHWDFGLIADEVEEVLPTAFLAAPPNGYQSLRELPIIAALVKAVQELSARVSALEGA